MVNRRLPLSIVATAALTASVLAAAQQQAPNTRAGWPCGARLDLSYFQIAEGSGGHLLLLAPEEIGDSATLLTALGEHSQTIARIAGAMQPGLHEFRVPIDSSVESALFSIGVQCLQSVEVVRPSGAPAIGDDVTDLSNFRAERMLIVRRPEPGTWMLRVSGTGISGIVVQARSAIGITQLDFASGASAPFAAVPKAGVENIMRIRMAGSPSDVSASLVNGTFQRVTDLPLATDDAAGTLVSRFTPGVGAFRVLVTGRDADGNAFLRVSAPLLTPAR